MCMTMKLHFDVSGDDFTRAGEASSKVKSKLKQLGIAPDAIRRVAIALYEGEINLVIHAGGGEIDVEITPENIKMTLSDKGPGIADIEKAAKIAAVLEYFCVFILLLNFFLGRILVLLLFLNKSCQYILQRYKWQ